MEKTVKKRIIFVIESLSLGGAEKSLVTLLNLLDYSKYDVDLLLFAQGGPFQELLPEEVIFCRFRIIFHIPAFHGEISGKS